VVDDGLYAGRKGRLGQMSGGFCRRIKKKLFIADLVGPVNYFLGNFKTHTINRRSGRKTTRGG
jgi:hypothetical protein